MRLKQAMATTAFAFRGRRDVEPWNKLQGTAFGDELYTHMQPMEVTEVATGRKYTGLVEHTLEVRRTLDEYVRNALSSKLTWSGGEMLGGQISTAQVLNTRIALDRVNIQQLAGVNRYRVDIDLSKAHRGAGNSFSTNTVLQNCGIGARMEADPEDGQYFLLFADKGQSLLEEVPMV